MDISQPIFRMIVLKRTIRSGRFPRARTFKAFDAIEGPATPADARDRLNAAHERYLAVCATCAERDGMMTSSVFGHIPVADYMRFTNLHTHHHRTQIPTSSPGQR